MLRSFVSLLLGAALTVGGAWCYSRYVDACFSRCGDGTRCEAHRCLAAAAASTAPAAPPAKETRRRRRGSASQGDTGDARSAAAEEVRLKPGDDKPLVQGEALGRPEHIDLTTGGDDARELTQEDLDKVFRPSDPAITNCITGALGDAPLATGKVEVGMRIEKSGEVSRVRVEGPTLLQRNGLSACVRKIVSALHFPRAGGASVVMYPFEIK